jgi:tetratricopeptide (TPR) repeat protein
VYNGEENEGKSVLQKALNLEPDNHDLVRAIKNIKIQTDLKNKASELFKNNKIQDAIEKFKECLNIDPLNINYNATIHLNLGMCKLRV